MSFVFTALLVAAAYRMGEFVTFYGPLPIWLNETTTLVPFSVTLVASAVAIAKRRADVLLPLHAAIIAIGMLATQFAVTVRPGDHFDPRLFMVTIVGAVTLQCSYVIVLAHLVGVVRRFWTRS